MDLFDKMSTFVRVIEAGNFSAAAKQLRLSAAAVSRQIAALETELGAPLFRRSTRKMVTTPAGQRYYERCLRVLHEVEGAQAVGKTSQIDGVLKVSAPVTFGLACIVPHLHSLMEKHPALRIDLRLEDRLVDLALEDVDVAVRAGGQPPQSDLLVAHSLVTYRRLLVASPAYLERRGEPKSPEALAKHQSLMHAASGSSDSWTLTREDRQTRVRMDVAFRCNALFALRDLARKGAGIAQLPDWFVEEELKKGELAVVLPAWNGDRVTAYAIHRTEHRGAPRVRALVQHFRASCFSHNLG